MEDVHKNDTSNNKPSSKSFNIYLLDNMFAKNMFDGIVFCFFLYKYGICTLLSFTS
jgi:hypothetical protein